jgi:DNA polymerase delta subunit 3
MLYEYQKFQNDVKPNSVYATYLIYGTKREEQPCVNGDGDVEMSGSAADDDLEPLSDAVHTSTLTLVAEADLKGMHSVSRRQLRESPLG